MTKRILILSVAAFLFLAMGGGGDAPFARAAPPEQADKKGAAIYVPPSFENIARVLWAAGVKDLYDDEAIDNYLRITECHLYQKFYSNEFKWKNIRDGTREYLEKYKGRFSHRFEYVQPLFLDRYDFALKGFPLMPDHQFTNASRIQISANREGHTKCPNVVLPNLKGYPSGAILNLKTPLNFSFVHVSEPVAQEYMKMIEEKGLETKEGRPAYIRFRVRVDQFLSEESIDQGAFANFSGAIEQIDVFADRELVLPLYVQDLD